MWQRVVVIKDEYDFDLPKKFRLCLGCYDDAVASGKIRREKIMAGKIPSFDVVAGKKQVAVFWDAQSKKGLNYHSGYIDVSAVKELVNDETVTKSRTVRNKDGSTREIKAMRVAMFKRTPREKKESASSGESW